MPAKKIERYMRVVPSPAHATFAENLPGKLKYGQYQEALYRAAKLDQVIEIEAADKYVLAQLRESSRKLKLALTYATDGKKIWVRPANNEVERKRLMLILRDRRTLAFLESQKLAINLKHELDALAERKLAHEVKGAWVLTERGMDLVVDPAHLAATA